MSSLKLNESVRWCPWVLYCFQWVKKLYKAKDKQIFCIFIGAVLLADTVPSLGAKLVGPFLPFFIKLVSNILNIFLSHFFTQLNRWILFIFQIKYSSFIDLFIAMCRILTCCFSENRCDCTHRNRLYIYWRGIRREYIFGLLI